MPQPIIPSDHQRVAIRAMEDVLAAIKKEGHSAALAECMASFKEREEIVATASYSPATPATPWRRPASGMSARTLMPSAACARPRRLDVTASRGDWPSRGRCGRIP